MPFLAAEEDSFPLHFLSVPVYIALSGVARRQGMPWRREMQSVLR